MEKHEAVWDAFPDHLVGVFRDLGEEGHFADVTIVSDDLIPIQTHKVVLSACSTVLKSLLVTNQHSNPMLYLRGIKHSELQALLKFMYNGETEILEERISEFLAVANDLGVQITHCFTNEEVSAKPERNHQKTSKEIVNNFSPPEVMMKIDNSLTKEVSVKHEENKIEKNIYLSEVVKLEETGTNQIKSEKKTKRWLCDQCESSYTIIYNLEKHKKAIHQNQIFLCDQCDYKSNWAVDLQTHIRSKHLEMRYRCDQCDYRATKKFNLKEHIQVKHEGGGYSCSECYYKAAQKTHLRRHFHTKHKDSAQKLKIDK